MKKSELFKRCVPVFLCCCLIFSAGAPAYAVDKKEVVKQARGAYYNLRAQGLVEFQCSVAPNWEAMLAGQRQSNPAGADEAMKVLKQLQFTLFLGPDGAAKVTHNTFPATNDQMAKGLDQIFSGMEQMLTGFFQTWSPFLLYSPFPEIDGDYRLEEQGPHWGLFYKDGSAGIVTIMNKEFAISELKVTTAEFVSVIRPQFTRIAKGLLLSGYQADYQGKLPAEATKLQVQIRYQEVNGLSVPQKLNINGSYGGSPFEQEITFTNCQVKKR